MQVTKHINHNNSRFGIGLVVGSVIGGIAALLLSPKSGKENREVLNKKMAGWKKMWESGELEKKVKEVFGDFSEESVKIYATARERVMQGIEEMRHMDGDDYAKLVQQVIDDVKKTTKISVEKLKKLQSSLIRDWPEMKDAIEKEGRKLAKDLKKVEVELNEKNTQAATN